MPSTSIPLSPSSSSCSAPYLSEFGTRSSTRRPPSKKGRPPLPPTPRRDSFVNSIRKLVFRRRNNNNLELTEESLDAHTKRTALKSLREEDTAGSTSHKSIPRDRNPYYGGLLGNTWYAHSYPPAVPGGGAAATESHGKVTSGGATRTSLASSFKVKIQGVLGRSCFHFRSTNKPKNQDQDHHHHMPEPPAQATGLKINTTDISTVTAASSSSLPSNSVVLEALIMAEETTTSSSNGEKKPLRESNIDDHDHDNDGAMPAEDHDKAHDPKIMRPPLGLEDAQKDFDMEFGQKKFLWADKYMPKALDEFICNRDKARQLQALARNGECGHFIFQGPPGVGKRTMIWAMLREAFGPDSMQASEVYKVFNVKGEVVGSIPVLVKESPRLVEVNLSGLKGYEKYIIFELIMETSERISNRKLPCKPPDNCRAIIFYGVDKLSTDAILYIKWLLERSKMCNKIFFCCSDVSKLQAIKNLCTVVKLEPPSRTEIVQVMKFIADKEGIELPQTLAEKITDTSKNNFRQAIRSFEATWLKHNPFTEDQEVLTGWEEDIAIIAQKMVEEQSPKLLYIIRGKLQNLVEHDVSPEFIFKSLVDEVIKHLENKLLRRRVHNLYLEYSRIDESMFESDKALAQARKSAQHFLRIEEFIAKFMSCYKTEAAKIMKEELQDSEDHNSET